jgi:hypothetical protein
MSSPPPSANSKVLSESEEVVPGPSTSTNLRSKSETGRKPKTKTKTNSENKVKTRTKPIPQPIAAFSDPSVGEEETVHEIYESIAPHFALTRHKVSALGLESDGVTRLDCFESEMTKSLDLSWIGLCLD